LEDPIMTLTDGTLYNDALRADDAWQAELRRTYGPVKAADARYDRRGVATPRLAELHDAFRRTTDAWIADMRQSR
jgi:hypothetical protein